MRRRLIRAWPAVAAALGILAVGALVAELRAIGHTTPPAASPTASPANDLPKENPPPRFSFAIAYDEERQQVVIFGGRTGRPFAPPLGDTWIWDGSRWSERHPLHTPPPASERAMAHDQNIGRVILYGAGSRRDETWAWDGQDWSKLSPTRSPGSRHSFLMAWDPIRRIVLLHGGGGRPNEQFSDTWAWDGVTWKRLELAAPDYSGAGGALAYDPILKRMMLYGATGGADDSRQLWFLESQGWSRMPYSDSSLPTTGPVMWTDNRLGRVVLFGGSVSAGYGGSTLGVINGLWIWSGARWEPLSMSPKPMPRWKAGAAFDSARRSAVLFGGEGEDAYQNPYYPDDTWTWQATGWRQVTPLRVRPRLQAVFRLSLVSPPLAGDVFHLTVTWPDGMREEADLWGGTAPPCSQQNYPHGGCESYAAAPREPDPGSSTGSFTITRIRAGAETVIGSGPVSGLRGGTYYVDYRG